MIFPNNFEQKIDFNRVRGLLINECISDLGKKHVEQMQFSTNFNTINSRLHETFEFKQILNSDRTFPTENYFDISEVLNKLQIDGYFIDIQSLHRTNKLLQTSLAIIRFFAHTDDDEYPTLKNLVASIEVPEQVCSVINHIMSSDGQIKDNASPELAEVRKELRLKQSKAGKLIHTIISKAQTEGWVDKETALSVRNGRLVIPIQASFKRKIQGIVHDESATGKTCFVEPMPVVEINNQIAELEIEEQRQINKILKAVTKEIKPFVYDIEDCMHLLGILDFTRAKALFAVHTNSTLPKLENKASVNWVKARHPLLYLSLKNENREIVPLNLQLDNENRILLISGPNAGGKSVCLKTTGLLQYMLQCGMLTPASDKSTVGVFNNIFIDIGDEQSIDNDLSTYSSHLMNMKYFVQKADNKTLILIDEFGTGTEPMLGGAIAEAVLEKLNSLQSFGVLTTHYTNLKHFASQQDGITNGAMLYDVQKLEPLFRLEIGKPGSSFAFEIAHKIGLSQDVIKNAKEKIGQDHIDFDKHLKDILKNKRYWERKRENIRKIERRMEEMMEKEKSELEQANLIRKQITEQTKNEAKNILHKSNKIIEQTVREIKEAKAEKEKTKIARQKLDSFKQDIEGNSNTAEEERIKRKIEKLKNREKKISKNKSEQKNTKPTKTEVQQPITIGASVRIKGQQEVGEVIQLDNKNAVVVFGSLRTKVSVNKLEHSADKQRKPTTKSAMSFSQKMELDRKRINFKPGLDVRGKRVDEALRMITQFIDEAIMVGVYEVKILHGKGDGILRQAIRKYLLTVDAIKSVQDAHIDHGGAGITVVTMVDSI